MAAHVEIADRHRDDDLGRNRGIGNQIGPLMRSHGVLDQETGIEAAVVEHGLIAMRIVTAETPGDRIQVQDARSCSALNHSP